MTVTQRWWETPAAGLDTAVRSDDWCDRLHRFSNAHTTFDQVTCAMGLNADSSLDYSMHIVDDPTLIERVYRCGVAGGWNVARGVAIPWNPKWKPSGGGDSFIAILDAKADAEWDLWQVSSGTYQAANRIQARCQFDINNEVPANILLPAALPPGTPPFDPATGICAAGCWHTPNASTWMGNSPGGSGAGIAASIGPVRASEVAAGVIKHVLKISVGNTMFGPVAPPDVLSADDPRVGVSCGLAQAPCGQFENGGLKTTSTALLTMLAEGTRFVLVLTDAQIEAWLDRRGYKGTLRDTAKVFAVALCNYGWFIGDSSGSVTHHSDGTTTQVGPAIFQMDGAQPAAWRALGIVDDGSKLLQGLWTAGSYRAVVPPVSTLLNGKTTRREGASPNVVYPLAA